MRSTKRCFLVTPPIGLLAIAVLLAVAIVSTACAQSPTELTQEEPATVERPDAGGPARVILTAEAASRLGIETAIVRTTGPDQPGTTGAAGGDLRVVPYSAILYENNGDTWVYTNPEPLVFVRARLSVVQIQGDSAIFSDGPQVGTPVVTVGAIELFGTEFEIGH